ncbi:MAG: dienelactone hydrolase family protein [Acidobacteriia bacterium]|nr:dienelactone hydrolase family protein [Terriglobia bacterium]
MSPAVVAVVIFLLVFVCVVTVGAAPTQTAPTWRYALHPGDHLIYGYTFQRRTQSDEEQTRVEARFRTHVLVAAEPAGRISLGFQRNREAAELTEYRSKGKDRLAHELPGFQKRMQARPSRFAEAMEISPGGEPLYPWEISRETYSHILDVLHEVMNLPPLPLAKGEAWRSPSLPQLEFRWVNDESIHGKTCHHVEGTVPDKSLKLSYWWSPESGVLEQVALDGNYRNFDTVAHETARMELESRTRGEQFSTWLDSADTRQGALQAILLTPEVAVSAGLLAPVLGSGEPASQALALAVDSRRKIDVPSGVLATLRQSASARVQLMAEAFSDSGHSQELADECRRPFPPRPPPVKFGTVLEVARTSKEDGAIPYLLRVPLTYREDRPAPLMIYLSGGAGFAIDGVNSAENIVSETNYLVLYPQAAGYWWTPEVARRLDAVLHDAFERYNVDRDRIFLTGFSNGGTGALYFATLWPQRFAAVVSLMGAGQCNEAVKAGLPNLGNLPLLFVHGENDPRITPDCSTTTHAALTDLHPAIKPELKILPHRAHDITLDSDDGLTLAFFKGKLRNPFPREVNLTLSDSLAARGYWVEILDGKAGKSSVEARVKADNTIEIHSHDLKRLRLYLRPELLPNPGDVHIVWNGKKMFSGPLRDVCALPPLPLAADPKLDLSDTRDLELP